MTRNPVSHKKKITKIKKKIKNQKNQLSLTNLAGVYPGQSSVRGGDGWIQWFRAFLVEFLGVRSGQVAAHVLVAPVVDRVAFEGLFV